MAEWLNQTFYNFDRQFFLIMNGWQKGLGSFLTPFFKFVSFFGEGGIFLICLSLFLMLFSSSRKVGMSMLVSIGVGALFTNVILKNAVVRIRPFYEREEYFSFWVQAGKSTVSEFSFPSGHTTVATTSMTALFLCTNKKKSWCAYIFVILTALARTYLIVHYLTDVIAGLVVGLISGWIGTFIAKKIYSKIDAIKHKKWAQIFIEFDLYQWLKSKKVKE